MKINYTTASTSTFKPLYVAKNYHIAQMKKGIIGQSYE